MNLSGLFRKTAAGVVTIGTLAVASGASALEQVKFGLNWLPAGQHCGFFQARDAGIYKKYGLDVELVSGGPAVNVGMLVAGGKMDFGMGSSFTTMNMINNNVDAVTIAAIFQQSPQTLVAHPGQGIKTLQDLKGKPIMVAQFSRNEFWKFLQVKHGFDDSQLRPYTYSPTAFLANKNAVQQGYVVEDAFFLGRGLTEEPAIILLADYGYSVYTQTIYGMRSTLEKRPSVAKAFVAATAEGYKECLEGDNSIADRAITAGNPEHTSDLFKFNVQQMKKHQLVMGGDAAKYGIGTMTDERWKEFFDTFKEAGTYPATLDWKKAYTLQFVR